MSYMQPIVPSKTAQRIAFVAVPGFQFMSLAALAAFEFAGKIAEEELYEVSVLSETGGLGRGSLGTPTRTRSIHHGSHDTLIVGVGDTGSPSSPALVSLLQRVAASTRRPEAI